jgi:hypothetical protein
VDLRIMKKYLIVGLSAFVLEIASTCYIRTVSDGSAFMLLWAFVGPFLSLPFTGYMVETKTWKERILLALTMGTGYMLGAFVVYAFTLIVFN